MGLLDDAIREHLELKRRRGADPSMVAREEREALGAVRGDEPAGSLEEPEGGVREQEGDGPVDVHDHPGPYGEAPAFEPEGPHQAKAPPVESSWSTGVGQETAELDMHSVLHDEPQEAPRAVRAPSLEPTGHPQPPAAVEREPAEEGSEDDVLEETPDFLRDTPEEDRLWFEQRPRDFDFDG